MRVLCCFSKKFPKDKKKKKNKNTKKEESKGKQIML